MIETRDIHYRPRGRVSGSRAGAHPSQGVGAFGTFRDQVPFMTYPDARRIDIRSTLRDPFESTFVRRFQQRSAIDVYALVDLTRSMSYQGYARKRDLVAEFCGLLARSVTRGGDRFGLIGFDNEVREDCFIPLSRRQAIASDVEERLRSVEWNGRNAAGLIEAARSVVGRRKMIFIVSDFILPLELLSAAFEMLGPHDLIPVVISDSTESDALPDWGLMELTDLETNKHKLVFVRPALKRRWLAEEAKRSAELKRIARKFGRSPLAIADKLDVDWISRQLMEA
jgi:uncharacterized protein (DUF58 family)